VGPFRVAFSADLRAGSLPSAAFYAGDRIVVVSESWQVFDRSGRPVRDEPCGMGPVVIDAERRLLLHVSRSGDLVASGLADGKRTFALMPSGGDTSRYPWFDRRRDRILIASVERSMDPHGRQPARKSCVEVIDLSAPPDVAATESRLLVSAVSLGKLAFPSTEMVAAGGDGMVVAAFPGMIFVVDDDLRIRAALEGRFVPLSLSVDESGRMHMVARVGEEVALLVISPAGEMSWTAALPPGFAASPRPPVVGYDHRVCVTAGSQLLAFGADGTPLWGHAAAGAIAGVTVTTDDRFLVGAGDEVGELDPDGRYRTIHRFEGETVCTGPVATERGEILVATATKLHCLAP